MFLLLMPCLITLLSSAENCVLSNVALPASFTTYAKADTE